MDNIYLTVIIPLYNEEKSILRCFEEVNAQCNTLAENFEIIFINDSSTDRTREILTALVRINKGIIVLNNEVNMGKGFSLRKGVNTAGGRYIVTTDADLSVPIENIPVFLNTLKEGYDIAIGTRKFPESRIVKPQPLIRRNLSAIYRLIARILINSRISDFTCGFKAYTNSSAKKLFSISRTNKWGIDAEIIYLAKLFNLKIKEMPVQWYHSGSTKVNLVFDIFSSLYELCKVKLTTGWIIRSHK
ncbi:MAG TPA: glycosyltransferase [bacterium]